jgi:hypothetical protein
MAVGFLDMIVIDEKFLVIKEINGYLVDMILINSFRSGDSPLDILTFDEELLVFKEIKIIFTRYDFDLLFPVGGCLMECYKSLPLYYTKMCFKILNFLGRKSVFLQSNLHYIQFICS